MQQLRGGYRGAYVPLPSTDVACPLTPRDNRSSHQALSAKPKLILNLDSYFHALIFCTSRLTPSLPGRLPSLPSAYFPLAGCYRMRTTLLVTHGKGNIAASCARSSAHLTLVWWLSHTFSPSLLYKPCSEYALHARLCKELQIGHFNR